MSCNFGAVQKTYSQVGKPIAKAVSDNLLCSNRYHGKLLILMKRKKDKNRKGTDRLLYKDLQYIPESRFT